MFRKPAQARCEHQIEQLEEVPDLLEFFGLKPKMSELCLSSAETEELGYICSSFCKQIHFSALCSSNHFWNFSDLTIFGNYLFEYRDLSTYQ